MAHGLQRLLRSSCAPALVGVTVLALSGCALLPSARSDAQADVKTVLQDATSMLAEDYANIGDRDTFLASAGTGDLDIHSLVGDSVDEIRANRLIDAGHPYVYEIDYDSGTVSLIAYSYAQRAGIGGSESAYAYACVTVAATPDGRIEEAQTDCSGPAAEAMISPSFIEARF